jgi:hypothetical protein
MGMAQRLLLVAAVLILASGYAAAQTMPWPTDPPRPAGSAPWPGDRAPPAASPGMSPAMGAPSPMGAPRMGGGGEPPCMAEFTKLRLDVEKKGMAAKAASQKKASREEMCKLITNYAAAETKWVKFTEGGVQSCGIPAQIAEQLKKVHANTEQTREKVCAAGPAAGPAAAPSLSDALGTTRMATPDAGKAAGSAILDTLTGSAVRR